MALTAGDRLGPYDVTAKIGEGGMGQVYRATDTKLDREVTPEAPEAFAADPVRLPRFQRETRLAVNPSGISHIPARQRGV